MAERLRKAVDDDLLFYTVEDVKALNGLVARAVYLIDNPPTPQDLTPPDGGQAPAMALAA